MAHITPMARETRPVALDKRYAAILRSSKTDFVSVTEHETSVLQHGAARISTAGWPGWPSGLTTIEPVIETFVAGPDHVAATSDNDPFVGAWAPLVTWMNNTVRAALEDVGVLFTGDAYVTASLTPTDTLEGVAHIDDDQFVPNDSVSMVAILGDLAGPRMATKPIGHPALRPMAPLTFAADVLDSFATNMMDRCASGADELVVLPQFGQLHAGPTAHHVAHLAPFRQLLVMRSAVALN